MPTLQKISSKLVHYFSSYSADRQTDKGMTIISLGRG